MSKKSDHTYLVGSDRLLSHNIEGCIKVTSEIKRDKKLVREAERAGRNRQAQRDIDNLVDQLRKGNTNPGTGTKHLFDGIYELRGRNGGRVYYRKVGEKRFEIVGKSDKGNQQKVINRLEEIYGK